MRPMDDFGRRYDLAREVGRGSGTSDLPASRSLACQRYFDVLARLRPLIFEVPTELPPSAGARSSKKKFANLTAASPS